MNRPLVIDAGIAFRLVLPGPSQATLSSLMEGWQREGCQLYAPSLWLYEITSAVAKSVHFGALAEIEGRRALSLAQQLPVELVLPDASVSDLAFQWTMRLRRAAAYDSFYIALAETLGCELWTMDKHLAGAAGVAWVRVPG